jgi:carboxyl-terminal processing protease
MVAADIGYIRISKFAETTYKEFMDAATGLQKKGMKKLVLDLRGNGGGIMTEATNIADELLSDGLDLVSTRGNHTRSRTITSTKPGILEEAPLVVLIDEFSASASEVLAAALQDNDRGTIMGRRSFGKGLVQEQYDLSNGAALRLTVARYYTPIGRSIQKPYHGDVNDYYGEAVERHLKADTAQPSAADSSVYTTRKGRKLYGGGGIAPDIVIDADTTGRGSADSRLFDPVLINQFAFQLFKKYQTQVRSFPSPEKFNQGFALNGADWNALFEAARTDSNATSQVAEAAALPADLERRIKANMARLVWRNNGYFSIMQPGDRYLAAAIEHLSKP